MGLEIDEEYCRMTMNRLRAEKRALSGEAKIEFSRADDNRGNIVAGEEMAGYGFRKSREEIKAQDLTLLTLKDK